MSRTGIFILIAAIVVSVAITVFSGGRFIFIGLPLLFGLPLAGLFGRKGRDAASRRTLNGEVPRSETSR